ncbi:MAG TPA: helix-turn-helix domain-containing protein [Puia sp.]|jgi:excisionase family DNA binding protein|nr:helix-turn-helix domain-containing protein [Puia sp.]
MTVNPFEELNLRFDKLESLLAGISPVTAADPVEKPINTEELCAFLGITRPTAVRYRKKGTIPFLLIGSAIRYDRRAVLKALEAKPSKRSR